MPRAPPPPLNLRPTPIPTTLPSPPETPPPNASTPPYTLSPEPAFAAGATSELRHGRIKDTPIAVKIPHRGTPPSTAIHEANVLSYLSTTLPAAKSLPVYYGHDRENNALLLELVSGGTLREHALGLRRENPGFLRQPVMGTRSWLQLARSLCRAVGQLHAVGVAHGDLTWSNVLLRNGEVPVLIDFSSAGLHGETVGEGVLTPGFCAPEVLEGCLKGRAVVGEKQDVYALGMVLLASAVGGEVYEGLGRWESIRAREGRPLEWLGSGDGGAVVRGVVGRVLGGCFGKDQSKRIGLEELAARVEGELKALDA